MKRNKRKNGHSGPSQRLPASVNAAVLRSTSYRKAVQDISTPVPSAVDDQAVYRGKY